ncbi:MAG TPA: hypothetical protein VF292_04525 [Rhodanobacteraceae bacterium]
MASTTPALIEGTWDVVIATPIGRLGVTMTFAKTAQGFIGTARGRGEEVDLTEISVKPATTGETVTWIQSITKPLRLNLRFEVLVEGDNISGRSRAGKLPASKVSGTRRLPG